MISDESAVVLCTSAFHVTHAGQDWRKRPGLHMFLTGSEDPDLGLT